MTTQEWQALNTTLTELGCTTSADSVTVTSRHNELAIVLSALEQGRVYNVAKKWELPIDVAQLRDQLSTMDDMLLHYRQVRALPKRCIDLTDVYTTITAECKA